MGDIAGWDTHPGKVSKRSLLGRYLPTRDILTKCVSLHFHRITLKVRHTLVVERGRIGKNTTLAKVLVGCIHVPSTEVEKDNKKHKEEEFAVRMADFLVVERRTKLDEGAQNNIKYEGKASAVQHSLSDVGIEERVNLASSNNSRVREMPPHAEENNEGKKELH